MTTIPQESEEIRGMIGPALAAPVTADMSRRAAEPQAGGARSLAALRGEAAALHERAALLAAASEQVERRLAELVARGAKRNRARITELRQLGRESVRLLGVAVRRRAALRARIADLERADREASARPQPLVPAPATEPPAPAATTTLATAPDAAVPAAPPPALPAPAAAPPRAWALPPDPSPFAPAPARPPIPAAPPPTEHAYPHIRRQRLAPIPSRSLVPRPIALGLRYVSYALGGLVLAVLAALLTPLPELFGWQIFAVQTGSMTPTIPVGSLIAVQPVRASDLREGDVITFSEQGRPDVRVTHRIVSLEVREGRQVAVTKGDANNTTDSWNVPLEQAIGRVAFHVPLLGYALAWLSSTVVKLGALALAGILLLTPELRRRLGSRSATAPQAQGAVEPARVSHPLSPQRELLTTTPSAVVTGRAALAAAAPNGRHAVSGTPADDEPEASFDDLANEIDALLSRLNGEHAETAGKTAR